LQTATIGIRAAPTSGGAIQFDIPIEQAKSSSWYSNPRPL